MIQNNKFFLKNFKTIFFMGRSEIFEKLINVNKNNGINTFLITSSDQAKNISSSLKPHIFDKIDENMSPIDPDPPIPANTICFTLSKLIGS